MVIQYLFLLHTLILQAVNPLTSSEAAIWLKQKEHKNIPIIDAREYESFRKGHLKRAINIDATSTQAPIIFKEYLHHESLFIYCNTHRRAGIAIELLKEAGYTGNIYLMSDGISGWKENKLPIKKPPFFLNLLRRTSFQ